MHLKQHMDDQFWIIFWLGLLTGAMLVTLLFTYQTIENQNFENSLLRSRTQVTTQTKAPATSSTSTTTNGITMPNE